MKLFLIVIQLFFSVSLLAQKDTLQTFYSNGNIESEIVYENKIRSGDAIFYYESGQVKEKLNFVNDKIFGTVTAYYENGNIRELYSIENGKREGPAAYYDSTGTVTEDVVFENGVRRGQDYLLVGEYREEDYQKLLAQWKARQEQKKNEKNAELNLPPAENEKTDLEDDPAYYMNVEVQPEPIGGMNMIYRRLVYPEEAKKNKIEGTVKVLAFIEKNGEVSSAEVVEGIGYGCDENAKLTVYYTRFKPGLQKGKRVKTQITIPVEFKLNESSN